MTSNTGRKSSSWNKKTTQKIYASCRIRTCDLAVNSRLLLPTELTKQIFPIVRIYCQQRLSSILIVGSEKCRIRTCKMAVLEAAAVAIEPTSQNELGYHHSVASLSNSASVRVHWPVHLIIILCISSAERIWTSEWWAENPLT